jgi:hypothetical protein
LRYVFAFASRGGLRRGASIIGGTAQGHSRRAGALLSAGGGRERRKQRRPHWAGGRRAGLRGCILWGCAFAFGAWPGGAFLGRGGGLRGGTFSAQRRAAAVAPSNVDGWFSWRVCARSRRMVRAYTECGGTEVFALSAPSSGSWDAPLPRSVG